CEAGTLYNRQIAQCVPSPGTAASTTLVDDDGANARWRHFVDVTVDIHPTRRMQLLLNADYATEPTKTADGTSFVRWYGANLGAKYAFADPLAVAVRGEIYFDPQGYSLFVNRDTTIADLTLTFLLT